MPAPLRRLLAACLLAGVLVVPARAAPAVAQGNGESFTVTISSMTPAAIVSSSQRGRLVIAGSVENVSHDDWTDISVALAPSTTPITSEQELTDLVSAKSPSDIGTPLAPAAQAVHLADLPAGQAEDFELSLPIRDLGLASEQGVYALDVVVFGTSPAGVDDQPDGVVRTLLPLMSRRAAPASLSIVVPFRATVARTPDGSLLDVGRWLTQVGSGGRLDNVLGFAIQATLPINLLVDPAVLDAIGSVSAGNPVGGESGSPGIEPAASNWLLGFRSAEESSTVLALPYGDFDVAGALDLQRDGLLTTAQEVTQSTLSSIPAIPVIAPSSGTLSAAQLRRVQAGDHLLLGSQAVPAGTGPTLFTRGDVGVTVSDALLDGVSKSSDSITLLRQTVLAELAVRSLSGSGSTPVVLSFPAHWKAPSVAQSGEFFAGLDQRWVVGVGLPLAGPDDPVLGYARFVEPGDPPAAVPLANFVVADQLIQAGTALAELLGAPRIQDATQRQALLSVSSNVAGRPKEAAARTGSALSSVTSELNKVSLSGPSFVTMSSGTGAFQVTITNKLDQDVVIGLSAEVSTPDLSVKPIDPVTVAAGQQRSVRVSVASHHLGVYRVTLRPVTSDGTPLPSSIAVSVRGSQIGQVIWVILGAAACLLFVTIGLRLVRRIRGRRG